MICDVRMDERLIHGQSMSSWIPFLGATHIIIAAKDIKDDAFQKSVLRMAAQGNYKLMITDGEGAAEIVNDPRSEKFKIFIICKSPQDVLDLVMHTSRLPRVNLAAYGRIEKASLPNRKVIVKGQLIVDEEDFDCLKKIEASGIKCVMQVMPEMPVSLISFRG